ncbi:hypothetical protein [Gordonia soli]|uniref:Acetyltransferase n=1 Tax=Gordonia soli NBRC 108243 TaxID=1223545 RepID=M0QDX5_9ACTN|nr:hypothetical protein [Gordonia soli]GAC66775.1 hypothetical protein GS4_04_00320 [Gordonia soli NBRC 108243]
MSFAISRLDLDGFDSLPAHTRRCVFWEVDPATLSAGGGPDYGDLGSFESEFDKEVWISGLLLDWGTCAQTAVESSTGSVVGSAFYAPPLRVPRSRLFPTSPVSADAILLTALRTEPGFDDARSVLLDAVVADLIRRGVRAIEAFGIVRGSGPADDASDGSDDGPRTASSPPAAGADDGSARLGDAVDQISDREFGDDPDFGSSTSFWSDEAIAEVTRDLLGSDIPDLCTLCMIDADFLKDSGFDLVASHPRFPRFRLELDSGLGWKSAVENALEKLVVMAAIDLAGRERTTPVPVASAHAHRCRATGFTADGVDSNPNHRSSD